MKANTKARYDVIERLPWGVDIMATGLTLKTAERVQRVHGGTVVVSGSVVRS